MKRAIVIILVLILVAGGGFGGLIMLGIVPNPFNPKMPVKPLSAAEKAAADLKEKNKFKPPLAAYQLFKVPDMVIPVIINGQSQRHVLLTARVMGNAASDKAFITDNMARYQDAVLNDLVPYFQNYFTSHDMLDAVEIKSRLVKHAKEIFGDHAKDVLMGNVFEQGSGRIQ